jgi:hypothetical protein
MLKLVLAGFGIPRILLLMVSVYSLVDIFFRSGTREVILR